MTAPTSPGVVPADDVRELVERLRRMANDTHFVWGTAYQDRAACDMGRAADMIERLANRPSLTEGEREQVRREALEEAALLADGQPFFSDTHTGKRQQWVKDRIASGIRALADRSEPRQEKEGKV